MFVCLCSWFFYSISPFLSIFYIFLHLSILHFPFLISPPLFFGGGLLSLFLFPSLTFHLLIFLFRLHFPSLHSSYLTFLPSHLFLHLPSLLFLFSIQHVPSPIPFPSLSNTFHHIPLSSHLSYIFLALSTPFKTPHSPRFSPLFTLTPTSPQAHESLWIRPITFH